MASPGNRANYQTIGSNLNALKCVRNEYEQTYNISAPAKGS